MGGRVEGEFFDALPEATDNSEDALRHGGCDMENGVEVVRHEAILEQFDLGVSLGDMGEVVNDGSAEFGALHVGLHGVIVGDDEFAEKRLARGDYHGDMIQTGAFPHRVGLLPLPCVVIHTTEFSLPQGRDYFSNSGAKVRFFFDMGKFSRENLWAPDNISANGRNFIQRICGQWVMVG